MSLGQRRLAAVMFTDMVDYTLMTQRNEALSLALVEEQRNLVRPILARHRGREVKTIGDAFMVEFASALDAVRCAYDIQRTVRELNTAVPEERRIVLRVGVHLGDVVTSEGDISGDAVNIASRIEPLAENGGVCVTRQVYDQVNNKFEIRLESIGLKQLKNVIAPVEVFRAVMPWDLRKPEPPLRADVKRIAVLPFANMSPDPADVYLSDGMTEELITSLSGIRELMVIARTSIMKYRSTQKGVSEIARELSVGTLVEGSVRKAGNRVRIAVQLVDAATESHVWARNYDRQLDDIFAIQSEIAEEVARELSVKLVSSERARLERRPTEDTEVYMLYLKGLQYWNERSDEGLLKAVSYFEKAVERDRNFALGYSGLANCYVVMGRNGPGPSAPNYQKARDAVERALGLDPGLAEAHAALGSILHHADYDWRAAEAEYRRAIELKPNYATAHQWYAHELFLRGRFAEGEAEITIAVRLDPLSVIMNHNMGAAYYIQGRFDEAIEWFHRANELDPSVLLASHGATNLIQAYALSGRLDEAARELEKASAVPKAARGLRVWRAYLLAAMKKRDEALEALRQLEEDYRGGKESSYLIAMVYFVLGDVDKGFEWLSVACTEHDGGILWMMRDHELAGVRRDPRFIAIQKAIGMGDLEF
jgi:adenylate cyclase